MTVTTRDVPGRPGLIPSGYNALASDVIVGNRILLADGLLELRVRRPDQRGTEHRRPHLAAAEKHKPPAADITDIHKFLPVVIRAQVRPGRTPRPLTNPTPSTLPNAAGS